MCNFLVGLILMILPLGFIVDEVAKEFENVIFIVWNLVLIEDSGPSMSAYVLFVKMSE